MVCTGINGQTIMYQLIVSTLFKLIIAFDVTIASDKFKIFNVSTQKENDINAYNYKQFQINNASWYTYNNNLCNNPLKNTFKCKSNIPMKLYGLYVLKFPLRKSTASRRTDNNSAAPKQTCQGWKSITPKIYSRNQPWPVLKDNEIDFVRYHSLERINNYLSSLQWKYPHIINVEVIGKSSEKRDLRLIRISTGEVGTKAVILIVGGMNANEWISSATALYAIQQLAENPVNNYMLAKADWYFIPIMNPDGFDYSHKQDHTWKKTRSRGIKSDMCFGVDLNQNFDSDCNFTSLENISCSSFYTGQNSFSEPEANAVLDFLTKNVQVQLFININNYGRSIDYPLESDARYVDDNSDLQFLAEKASYAIYKYGGYRYTVNGFNSCGSEQWAKRQGIKYVYNIKLPAGEELGPESQVPESEILPIAQEVFVAFRQLQQILVSIYGVTYDLIADD